LRSTPAEFDEFADEHGGGARRRRTTRHAAIHGLIGSLAKEYPQWKVRLLDLPADEAWPVDELARLPFDAQGDVLAYRHGEWFEQTLVPARVPTDGPSAFREGGVYVVIGGAGGIGGALDAPALAGALIAPTLSGIERRAANAEIERQDRRAASGLGPTPISLQADASGFRVSLCPSDHRNQSNATRASTVSCAPRSYWRTRVAQGMSEEIFRRAALEAKVDLSVRIAQAFRDEALDFQLSFSSVTAFSKSRRSKRLTRPVARIMTRLRCASASRRAAQ